MPNSTFPAPRPSRAIVWGFIAGFVATLVFHQPVLALLASTGFVKAGTYAMQAVPPFGVPQVVSLAFWGGVWGMLFALIHHRFPRGAAYWLTAFLFGAILPTLVAWFVVATLKGQPTMAGGDLHRMLTGLLINGAWGVGTGMFLRLFARHTSNPDHPPPVVVP